MTPEQELHKEVVNRCSQSFEFFLNVVNIKQGTKPCQFIDCMAPHQRKTFNKLSQSIEAIRIGEKPPISRAWIERTKKASKDSDIALILVWLLAFPKRPMLIQVGASDKDQAAIVRSRMEDVLHYNEWLRDLIEITKYNAKSTGEGLCQLEIEAADIGGSHGATPDLLVCNELSHVTKWEFMQNLLDNADGVPQGMVIIATNAGVIGSEVWKLRESVLQNSRWAIDIYDRPAPWHSKDFLDDARKRNTPSRFNRLWKGIWSSGKGDAFENSLIDDCLVPGLRALTGPEVGWNYVGGLDLGVSHDHAGLVILGSNTELQKIRLAFFKGFAPDTRTGEVDLIAVRETLLGLHRLFKTIDFGYDPHQAELMAQELRRKGVSMRRVPFTGSNLTEMANTLKSVLESKKLIAYDEDNRIRNDLGKFNIVEKSYGLRLEAISDSTGHADVGTALAIALPRAVVLLNSGSFTGDETLVYEVDSVPSTKDELEEMPEGLRLIYEAYDDISVGQRKRVSIRDELF